MNYPDGDGIPEGLLSPPAFILTQHFRISAKSDAALETRRWSFPLNWNFHTAASVIAYYICMINWDKYE